MKKSNLQSSFIILTFITLILACGSGIQSFGADCDWNSGDPHKMHWPQEPDLSSTGVDISMYISTLADDFKCSSSGPINDIHIWGSFINDTLPPNGPDSLTFELSIYSDIPGQGDIFSKPGDLLWTKTFVPGEYSALKVYDGPEDWYDPPRSRFYPDNHQEAYQYNFCIEDNPFSQEEGTIYWLVVNEIAPDNADYKFGWKTTSRDLRWNDNAVYKIDGYFSWNETVYPDGHEYKGEKLDLAFVITSDGYTEHFYDWGDAPDGASAPGYPTMSFNNGAYHIIAGPWFGDDDDQPDAELNGQPELKALGDDLDIEPLFSLGPPNDDEDGVSIPPMYRDHPADINLKVNGGGGFVDAWIDFNNDKTWQASEQICWWFLPDGPHTISFIIPDDAVIGKTFARFRISSEGLLPPWGSALDGEVEDYQVTIYEGCTQCTGQEFIRGDANQDTQVDDTDVTLIMQYVLSGAPKPACMDAADADDNGIVDLSDTTYILHYLNGGPQLPEPFPDCGPDPTIDTLTCDQFDRCPGCVHVTPRYAKWFQLPDVTTNGVAIQVDNSDGIIRTIADDFECINNNLLTDVHLWCSWVNDKRGVIKKIHLSIHSDDPVGSMGYDPDNLFSKPAPNSLWEMDFFRDRDQFQETLYYTVPEPGEYWWDPPWMSIGVDRQIWRIDIDIDPNVAFLQQGTLDDPRIYWLSVHADVNDGELGWKTRRWPDHYMDDAVMVMDTGTGLLLRTWQELRYPSGHPYNGLEEDSIDMAFCLTYTEVADNPTSMPAGPTQCPIAATQCPTIATRCPTARTQCPAIVTRCPPLETQCVAITTCPPTETTCPVAQTVCPITMTECPVYETRCPPEFSKCPPAPTQCTTSVTECPPLETRCPVLQTECPVSITECPPEATTCHTVMTECPPAETRCPPTYSKCPPVLTQCTAVETECPPDDTRCPASETECPAEPTRCPYEETLCPAIYTKCPPAATQCKVVPTQCPTETICPAAYTKCPITETLCPYIETQCPAEPTLCQMVPTECPVVITQCPQYETWCTYAETQCPYAQTKCPPPNPTGSCDPPPIPPWEQIVMSDMEAEVKFSSIRAGCPAIHVKCPTVIDTQLLSKAL